MITTKLASIALGVTTVAFAGLTAWFGFQLLTTRTELAQTQTSVAQCETRSETARADGLEDWIETQRVILEAAYEERIAIEQSINDSSRRLLTATTDFRSYIDANPLDPACRVDAGRVSRVNAGRAHSAE